MKSASKKRAPTIVNLTVKRRYLTQREIERLMDYARKHGRYGHRDATMILVAYRHPRVLALSAAEQERVTAHDTTSSVRVSLLRVLRLGLRGAGRAAGSATPSTTLALAPASRLASISLSISS